MPQGKLAMSLAQGHEVTLCMAQLNTVKGLTMRIAEIVNNDTEKQAADALKQRAKQMQQQAKQAQARVKLKSAQQQMRDAVKAPTP